MDEKQQKAMLAGGQVDWECPHCHKHMKVIGKGNHLKYCKLNPDRPGKRDARPRVRTTCEWCGKEMDKRSLTNHQNRECRVLKAVRGGRVVLPLNTYEEAGNPSGGGSVPPVVSEIMVHAPYPIDPADLLSLITEDPIPVKHVAFTAAWMEMTNELVDRLENRS